MAMDIIPPRGSANRPAPADPAPASVPSPSSAPAPQRPSSSSAYPKDPRFSEGGGFRQVLSFVGLLLTAFAIAFILNAFVIQSYQVDGESMETTLQNNDRLIVDKIPRTISRITGHQYVPARGQIIIFNEDGLPGFAGPKQLIKRVVGLPGERVVVNNASVTIYNAQHPNGFNPDRAGIYSDKPLVPASNIHVDVTLQKDELFVMGDNRGNSEDSRYFGPIKTNQVVAKLSLRIMPLNKAQKY